MAKNQYTILIITDHDTHSSWESIYYVLPKLKNSKASCVVIVASKSDPKNKSFAGLENNQGIFAKVVDENFDFAKRTHWYDNAVRYNISDIDAVHLKLDPPVDDNLLEVIASTFFDKPILNSPKGILKWGKKEALLNLSEYCPPMFITSSFKEVLDYALHNPVVLKPSKGFGGKGLALIRPSSSGIIHKLENQVVSELQMQTYFDSQILKDGSMLCMDFISGVKNGDKRILMAGQEVLGGMNRIPSSNSWLANTSQGAKTFAEDPSPDERKLALEIADRLSNDGIFMFGADFIRSLSGVPYLSEVNVTNVGGLRRIELDTGRNTVDIFIKEFWSSLKLYTSPTETIEIAR